MATCDVRSYPVAIFPPGAFGIVVPGFHSETMYLGRVEFVVETEANSAIVVEYRPENDGVGEGVLNGSLLNHYPSAEATIRRPVGC